MTKEKWDSMSQQEKEGLINKWKKDIKRNEHYLNIAKELLKQKEQ